MTIITLTTDFGHKGPFVGVMKGVILAHHPAAKIIDLTHDIPVHWPVEAGFWLARSHRWFPAGSVHVAVVDPGVGTGRQILVAAHAGQVFLAPDNGLLAPVLGTRPAHCYRLDDSWRRRQGWPEPSSTFHGRDIFAPLAAAIAAGRVRPEEAGPPAGEIMPALVDEPETGEGEIRGTVVALDNFGNLITNIDAALLRRLRVVEVLAGGHRLPLRRTYGESQPGDYLALVNSFDVLEIARAEGSAAEGLGLGRGAPVLVRRTVR
ncbi:MAG: SAM-dependent chlorinase/fluorinase [Chromatiales bacterium]|nr:SAM-dependent chlorinase/fluorinase [Chromatiales bacterium]